MELVNDDLAVFTAESDRIIEFNPWPPNRLRKKGVSVKLPCRWSQEHDDVRP
jgi:hypothetical protein